MRQLRKIVPPRDVDARPAGDWQIPAIIHQTFKAGEVTAAMATAVQSWIDLNPDYEYRFYDDEAAADFIATHFDDRTVAAYSKIDVGAFKADFWRYCVLYVEGGVYADIDTAALLPLSEFLVPEDEFVSARAGRLAYSIYNCLICARPGHPFLAAAVKRSTEALLRLGDRYDGYMVTGPGNLGQAANLALGREEQAPHAIGPNIVNGTAYRLLEKRSKTAEMRRHLVDADRPILFTEYAEYQDDLKELGVCYWRDIPIYSDASAKVRQKTRRILGLLGR